MKKWKVSVAQKLIRSQDVIVKADTEEEAREKARDVANERPKKWSDGDVEDDWVEEVEEVTKP